MESKTRLIWITPNAESLIAFIARVSNPENQSNPEYKKLIKYLIYHRHWSPFEMVNACFEIKTGRDISAQIIRHRSFSFQEFSTRYSKVTEIEPIELRRKAARNRQSSEEVFDPIITEGDEDYNAAELVQRHIEMSQWLYNRMIEEGVAKECARRILPLAASTTLYMNGTLRSWTHYLQLRNDEHAQKEHRLIAQEIELTLRIHFPFVKSLFAQIKIC